MAKITLDTVTGGYDLSVINNNFDKIETEFQNKVLYRDNPVGEANTLQTDIDVNEKIIYNLPEPLLDSQAARLQDIQNAIAGGAANLIPFTPYKNIAASNIQSALQEEIDDLESTTAGRGASLIGIQDAAAKFTGTTVETALSETRTSAELSATSGSSLIGFLQTGAGANTRTVESKLKDFVNVKDFGAVGDGVTDDTAALQEALSSGHKYLYSAPENIYRITNTLTINTDRVVLDFAMSEILLDDATGLKDHIIVGDGITQKGGIKFRNITFTRQQVATAGYAIKFNFVGVCEVFGCRIFGNNEIYNGINVLRGTIVNIQNNYIDNCINFGINLEGTGTGANRTIDTSVRENRIEGGLVAINSWNFVEGVFCRDNILFNTAGGGAVINASSNANGLVSFKFQDNDFDSCGTNGIYIDNVSNIQITDCWFSNNTQDDIVIKSNVDSCIIASNQIYPNQIGINIEGDTCRVDNNLISGGTTCINLANTADRPSVSSNTLANAQFGIALNSATQIHFEGNHIYNMSSGSISGVGGTGTTIQNNKGDGNVGGNSFITVGASPFTYTAGSRPEYVSVFSGTVSQIALGGNAIAFNTDRSVVLAPNQSVIVTYSSVPFMVKNQL